MSFSTIPFHQKIAKPWGYEVIFTPRHLPRVGKILFVEAGKRLSLQYHDSKEETLCLLTGNAVIWLEDEQGEVRRLAMERHKGYTISLMQKHRLEAVEDSFVVECSEPEKGNTFRLEDDYARGTETEEMRRSENRGWSPSRP